MFFIKRKCCVFLHSFIFYFFLSLIKQYFSPRTICTVVCLVLYSIHMIIKYVIAPRGPKHCFLYSELLLSRIFTYKVSKCTKHNPSEVSTFFIGIKEYEIFILILKIYKFTLEKNWPKKVVANNKNTYFLKNLLEVQLIA